MRTMKTCWGAGLAFLAFGIFGACDKGTSIGNNGSCGDGLCSETESTDSCPADCSCGNGTCDQGEDISSCAQDCSTCGDGQCTGDETCTNCSDDCGACPSCGDGTCNGDEDCTSCPDDCGACGVCGNGIKEQGEDCDGTDLHNEDCVMNGFVGGTLACTDLCLFDTSGCYKPECGNHVCEAGEDHSNCPADCSVGCGDDACSPTEGETCGNCPGDCSCGETACKDFLTCLYQCQDQSCAATCHEQGCKEAQEASAQVMVCLDQNCQSDCVNPSATGCASCVGQSCGAFVGGCYQTTCPGTCGDGTCDSDEDHATCPQDCPLCGDGSCDPGEDSQSCPADCTGTCGDGYCDETEDCSTCASDCGTCPSTCGNGDCEAMMGESCASCPQDCTCGDQTCSAVLQCMGNCNTDQACIDVCQEQGCYEAQTEVQAIYACILTNCAMQCVDPNSQACLMCMGQNCNAEAQACQQGTCP
ncbi:MAG: hypothetical protein J7M25_01630 [Deltaproteobacteria bacterium]|nr:hypothetical protein [Deltaproteobacteria bacterium]